MDTFNFGLDSVYSGWKPVDKNIILYANKNIEQAEYFNSFIYQQYNGMKYKIINDELVVIRLVPIMGNYNAIRYCGGYGSIKGLSEIGITVRGNDVVDGKSDDFGSEFVYDTDELIAMKGKKFETIRNIKNKLENFRGTFTFQEKSILSVIQNWSKATDSKHQLKLWEFIKKNKDICNFTTVYYGNYCVGFSVTEVVNEKNGIIIQQLINPEIKSISEIKEPNILIHLFNCMGNHGMKLNIGGARNEQIRVAKSKLQPSLLLPIYRKVSEKKLTKLHYETIKKG